MNKRNSLDKKTKSNETKPTKQELYANPGAYKLTLSMVLSSLILPGIFGLLFTGIPFYVGFYMQVYLISMIVDLVVGWVLTKAQKGPRDVHVAKYMFFQVYLAGIWAVLDAWRVVNFQIGLGILY